MRSSRHVRSDRAASAGEDSLAIEAAITAFETSPSVSAFEAVEELAADNWETIKTDLLEYLRTEQLVAGLLLGQ